MVLTGRKSGSSKVGTPHSCDRMTKPKKINTFEADTSDIDKEEVGEYYPYDGLPSKVGDLVILEIYPKFDDIIKQFDYVKEYPPEYLCWQKSHDLRNMASFVKLSELRINDE